MGDVEALIICSISFLITGIFGESFWQYKIPIKNFLPPQILKYFENSEFYKFYLLEPYIGQPTLYLSYVVEIGLIIYSLYIVFKISSKNNHSL